MSKLFKFLILVISSSLCFSCASNQPKIISKEVTPQMEALQGVWEDPETKDLHVIKRVSDGFTVSGIIEYGADGKAIIQLPVKMADWGDGSLTWTYFVPATGFSVTFKTLAFTGDDLLIEWTNDNGKGKSRTGQDKLLRMMGKYDVGANAESDKEALSSSLSKNLFGKVYKVNGDEIVISSKNVGDPLFMGDKLTVLIEGKKIELEVLSPMQTVSKCRLSSSYRSYKSKVKINMPVYKL